MTEETCGAVFRRPDPAYPRRIYRYVCVLPPHGPDVPHEWREDRRIGVSK